MLTFRYDRSKFYIECDACGVWYHGECVNVRAEDAASMPTFTCSSCLEKQAPISCASTVSSLVPGLLTPLVSGLLVSLVSGLLVSMLSGASSVRSPGVYVVWCLWCLVS